MHFQVPKKSAAKTISKWWRVVPYFCSRLIMVLGLHFAFWDTADIFAWNKCKQTVDVHYRNTQYIAEKKHSWKKVI